MSATSELLAEQLRIIDEQIKQLEISGDDTTLLRKKRSQISEQFQIASQALHEGKTILKG
jgi:hypothetical protein